MVHQRGVELTKSEFFPSPQEVWSAAQKDFYAETDTIDVWITEFPDGFKSHIEKSIQVLFDDFNKLHSEINDAYDWIMYSFLIKDRKEFEQAVHLHFSDLAPYLFLTLDKQYDRMYQEMWESLKPRGDTPITTGGWNTNDEEN